MAVRVGADGQAEADTTFGMRKRLGLRGDSKLSKVGWERCSKALLDQRLCASGLEVQLSESILRARSSQPALQRGKDSGSGSLRRTRRAIQQFAANWATVQAFENTKVCGIPQTLRKSF